MKSLIFAAALMLGGAAMAQDTTGTGGTSGTSGGTTTETTGDATTQDTATQDTATQGTATQGSSMGSMPMPGGAAQAAGNQAPERDARGIAVISAGASAPQGYNQPAQTGPAGTIQPTPTVSSMGSAGNLPPCSRKVTDHCTQTYERGARTPR
jgi:hypothetical protein